MYHPDGFKSKKKYLSLPIEPIYSPVTITKNGPVKSQPKLLTNNLYNCKFILSALDTIGQIEQNFITHHRIYFSIGSNLTNNL